MAVDRPYHKGAGQERIHYSRGREDRDPSRQRPAAEPFWRHSHCSPELLLVSTPPIFIGHTNYFLFFALTLALQRCYKDLILTEEKVLRRNRKPSFGCNFKRLSVKTRSRPATSRTYAI